MSDMVLSDAKGEQVNEGAQGEVQRKEQHQQAAAADAHAGCPRFLRRGVRLRPAGATPRQGAGDGELPAVHGSAGGNGNSAKGGKRRQGCNLLQ